MRDRANTGTPVLTVSLPVFSRMIDPTQTMNSTITWERMFIMLKEPSNTEHVKKVIADFKSGFNSNQANNINIFNYYDDTETIDEVSSILNWIFNVIIAITMFLCFFSLCSSMSANLLDQTKEIGILRAMGFTKNRIKLLYFYEAYVLVIASCLLGVMIGTIVGFTMVIQQVVFTSIPFVFFFPWSQFILIMIISILCAFLSTWGPTRQLVQKDIAIIFRSG
mmetsp:Transcript_18017/g.30687  ORF Transcript_18017/g.30687 Transcript_18017/m.30687 type:complete len:222 (+) Transcript_18017:2753-3418(+)